MSALVYQVLIFDRCCRISAVVTPVRYECDTNNLACTLTGSKILLTEKLTNGALVTPTPGQWKSCFRAMVLVVQSYFWCTNLTALFWIPSKIQGAVSIWKCYLTSIGIPIIKIRQFRDHFIFNMGIPIPGKGSLYIETGPWCSWWCRYSMLWMCTSGVSFY